MIKRIGIGLTVSILLMMVIVPAYAADISSLDRIDIKATLDTEGNASINETWNATVTAGSEASKQLIHLNGSKVSDYTVINEVGREYKLMQPWDSSKNRLDKFTSSGLMERMNGDVTLYWGLGDYGTRAYTLNYNISNMVKKCRDAQFMYYTFVSPGTRPSPKKIKVELSLPDNIDIETLEIYGYGYEGQQDIDEQSRKIIIETYDRKLTSSSYMVVLIRFIPDSFNSTLSSSKTFSDILNEANEGQGLGVVTQPLSLKDIVIKLMALIIVALLLMYIVSTIRMHRRLKNELGLPIKFIFDKSAKELQTVEEVEPFNILKDYNSENLLYEIYTVGLQYKLIQNEYSLFGAMIVKWLLNGSINIETDESKSNYLEITLLREPDSNNPFELDLYRMISNVSESEHIEIKELEKWFRDNHSQFTSWTDEILRSEGRILQDKGLCNSIAVSGRVQKKIDFIEYKTTAEMTSLAEKIQGFKRFIREISKQSNIGKTDEYIVYAQLFTITNIIFDQLGIINKSKGLSEGDYYGSISDTESSKLLIAINKITSLVSMRIESSKKLSSHIKINNAIKSKHKTK